MIYKHFPNQNYEDFACGRVIYHQTGYPNYPVRLAGEIFMRCLEHINKRDEEVCLYDPCCGGAYMLTVLGFLSNKHIKTIFGSDISEEAVWLAENNLSLLKQDGLNNRKKQLMFMYEEFGKNSHKDALCSIENFSDILLQRKKPIDFQTFHANILDEHSLTTMPFKADIVMTDVPYGNLVSWSDENDQAIDVLLTTLIPILSSNSIVAISCDKKQKICNKNFKRVEKFQVGKRRIELLRFGQKG